MSLRVSGRLAGVMIMGLALCSAPSLAQEEGAAPAAEGQQAEQPQAAPQAAPAKDAGIFERMDTNGDGLLALTEAAEAAAKRFGEIDVNTDGFITDDDISQKLESLNSAAGAVPAEHQSRREAMLRRHFESMDGDGDGKVSQKEFVEQAKARHARIDADADGNVTRKELDAMRDKLREKTTSPAESE